VWKLVRGSLPDVMSCYVLWNEIELCDGVEVLLIGMGYVCMVRVMMLVMRMRESIRCCV
jgi:hypothetical protein